MANERGGTMILAWPFVGRQALLSSIRHAASSAEVDVVIVLGAAGVGKTRLCREATSGSGPWRRVHRVAGSPSLRSVPLGALAPILPAEVLHTPPGSEAVLLAFHALRTEFSGHSRRDLLVVDDAAELDDASMALISQLVDAGLVQLLATHRAESTMSPSLSALSRRRGAIVVEVGELSEAEGAALIESTLGPANVELVHELLRRSAGNALFLVELLRAAVMSGAIAEVDGRWVQTARLTAGAALRDIVGRRLEEVSPHGRKLAETLALCQPLPEHRFTGAVDAAAVDELERFGLVARDERAAEPLLSLAHPLFGETLVGQMTARSRTLVLRDEIEFAERREGLAPAELLRLSLWRVDARLKPDIDTLAPALNHANSARDYETTALLAETARDHGVRDWSIDRHYTDALYELGRFDEAVEVAEERGMEECDPIEAAERAYLVSKVLQWGRGDANAAVEVLEKGMESTPFDVIKNSLGVAVANVLAFSDRPSAALTMLTEIGPSDHLVGLAAEFRGAALLQLGETVQAIECLSNAPVSPQRGTFDIRQIIQALARIEHGDIGAGIEQAERERRALIGLPVPMDRIWSALVTARGMLFAGRPVSAARWAADALETSERAGVRAGQALALSLLAITASQLGDIDGALRFVERQRSIDGVERIDGFLRPEWALGDAWAKCAAGQPELGRRVIVIAAEQAGANGQVASEAMLWHDHARLGGAPNAARLAELAGRTDSKLVAARAAHVTALARRNAADLETAARMLAAVGCMLAAAEALTAAADAAVVEGDRRAAERLRRDASAALEGCEGALVSGIAACDTLGPVSLSAREQDVVRLVVSGLSSREIADALYISTRTVDNHLQRIYAKVGVTGRRELRVALAAGAKERDRA